MQDSTRVWLYLQTAQVHQTKEQKARAVIAQANSATSRSWPGNYLALDPANRGQDLKKLAPRGQIWSPEQCLHDEDQVWHPDTKQQVDCAFIDECVRQAGADPVETAVSPVIQRRAVFRLAVYASTSAPH